MAWHISNKLYEKWRSSQALEVASLEESSSDGNASAQLNGNHTPLLYLPPDRMKAFSRLSRFGMTFRPLTDDHGEDLLTWYREAFLARTSAQPGKEQASQASGVECGSTWLGSLAKFDRATCSWRTAQCSLLGDLTLFSETWPRWGTMRNGECSERLMPELHTDVNESGLWRTPTAHDWKNTGNCSQLYLSDQVRPHQIKNPKKPKVFPTPTVLDATMSAKGKAGAKGMHSVQLSHIANSGALMAEDWQAAQDAMRANGELSMAERKLVPTPSRKGLDGWSNSRKAAKSRGTFESGGALNPDWVEMLMGWPKTWTILEPMSEFHYLSWLMGCSHDENRRDTEALQMLRKGNDATELRKAAGGYEHISEAPLLLTELREHANRPNEARVFVEGAETPEGIMRILRIQAPQAGASHRPGQPEQRPVEHSDALQALPRLLAHYGEKAWQDGSWENATPRVADGVAARVDRLSALGNGQVPQVMAMAFCILHERLSKRVGNGA